MSLQKYIKPPQERHADDRYEEAPLYGHAMTVGELMHILATVDPDLPISLEGCDCQGDLGWVSFNETDSYYRRMLWLRRTTTMREAEKVAMGQSLALEELGA